MPIFVARAVAPSILFRQTTAALTTPHASTVARITIPIVPTRLILNASNTIVMARRGAQCGRRIPFGEILARELTNTWKWIIAVVRDVLALCVLSQLVDNS